MEKVKTTITTTIEEKKWLLLQAKKEGVTISELISKLIRSKDD
jgi:hypothetical protein